MLTEKDKMIAEKLKHRLKKILPIIDYRIFGSTARGEASSESDMDVFIEVENVTIEQRQKIREIAFEIGFEMDRIISTFVVTKDQLVNGPIGASPIMLSINEEGIRL